MEIIMADAENNVASDGAESKVVEQVETEAKANPVAELEVKLAKLQKDLDNARKGEKFAKSTREELAAKLAQYEEQGDYKAKYEEAVKKLEQTVVDSALTEAAKSAKAKSIPAILKLIDRNSIQVKDGVVDTKSVEAAIAATKESFGLLFEEVQLPPTGRAAEGDVTSGYEKEIRAAKSQAEIIAVMKRYNKA